MPYFSIFQDEGLVNSKEVDIQSTKKGCAFRRNSARVTLAPLSLLHFTRLSQPWNFVNVPFHAGLLGEYYSVRLISSQSDNGMVLMVQVEAARRSGAAPRGSKSRLEEKHQTNPLISFSFRHLC